jgi:hypothetical protein
VAEEEAMLRGGGDCAHGRQGSKDQGDQIHDLLELPYVSEAGVEGDDQEEGEEHLHAGDDDAQLACELLEVAVQALQRRLVTLLAALARVRVGKWHKR